MYFVAGTGKPGQIWTVERDVGCSKPDPSAIQHGKLQAGLPNDVPAGKQSLPNDTLAGKQSLKLCKLCRWYSWGVACCSPL